MGGDVLISWQDWLQENRRKFESDWEETFVSEILVEVQGLNPEAVFSQTGFQDFAGRQRWIDFTIQEGDDVRIALEVDGWDKTGTKTGQTHDEFDDWSYRELSMAARGWVPLRFSNRLIKRKPGDLREAVRLQLKMQRKRAEVLRKGGEEARRAIEAESRLTSAANEAQLGGQEAEKRFQELQGQRLETDAERLDQNERDEAVKLLDEIDRLNRELDNERRKREQAEEECGRAEADRNQARKENRGMKFVIGAAVAIVGLVVVAAFLLGKDDGDGGGSPFLCDKAVPSSEVSESDLGEQVTVRSTVEGYKRLEGDNGAVFLNLGADYPDQDLAVVIWEDSLDNWGEVPPEDKYDGREVALTGKLESYQGTLEVEANSPNDVVVCP